MSDSNHAVFLSYAREDTEPTRRIAEALLNDPKNNARRY
jgi:hypothetical protein